MRDPDLDRRSRTQAIRLLLYPILFSPDLSLEVDRVSRIFVSYPEAQLASVIQETRAELAQPLLRAADSEQLVSNATEEQVRAFLAAVVGRLEADLLHRGGT